MNEEIRKKKQVSKESFIQIGFILIALIFSAVTATLLKFSLESFRDPSFYARTVINFILMLVSYKIIKNLTIKQSKIVKSGEPLTPYQQSAIEYGKKSAYIKKNKLEHIVEKGTAAELERRRIVSANAMLDNITYNLKLEDIIKIEKTINEETKEETVTTKIVSIDEIDMHSEKYRLSKKERKILHKTINLIINNKIDYEKFTAKDVLVDSEIAAENQRADKMTMNTAKYNLIETRNKAISSLFSAVIFNAFAFDKWSWSIISSLIGQAVLITSSIIGGIFAANAYLAYRKQIFDNRIYFLNSCDINFSKTE